MSGTGRTPQKVSVQEILKQVDRLPQLPEAAMRLTQLMENPDASAEDMAKIIRIDPDMTTQVLRLCNSAAYGLNRRIETVREAVAILGTNTLKSLVYVIISKFALDREIKGYGLERGALWYNALTCAVYGKHLAEKQGGVDPEVVFTGGLLRDIGKIVLGDYVGPMYGELERVALEKKIDFTQAEKELLGVNHCMVGKKIAEKWKLPERLIKVIQYKNTPSLLLSQGDRKMFELVTLVHLADAFAKMVGCGIGSDGLMYALDQKALQEMGITLDNEYMDSTLCQLIELNSIVDDMANSLKGA